MAESINRKTILVVEDDQRLRQLSSTWLRSAGYDVLTAENAPAALAHLAASKIDLALLDIDLSAELDGIDVLKHIRAEPATAKLPVMILSGNTRFEEIQRGVDAGADHYMTKPYEMTEMLANVRLILGPGAA